MIAYVQHFANVVPRPSFVQPTEVKKLGWALGVPTVCTDDSRGPCEH